MLSALIITIVVATTAILSALWAIHKNIQARLDHMTAQTIITRRRAHKTELTPEQRRSRFRLIQGGASIAGLLTASTWLYENARNLGGRTMLAAAGGSVLLFGGSPDLSEAHHHAPALTHQAPAKDRTTTDTDTETAPTHMSPEAPSSSDPMTALSKGSRHAPSPDQDHCRLDIDLPALKLCL